MNVVHFQAAETVKNLISHKSVWGRDKGEIHDILCPVFLLLFYLSVTCLFPRVQRKCSLHFLMRACGEYPPVIYLSAGANYSLSNGDFLLSSAWVIGFRSWPFLEFPLKSSKVICISRIQFLKNCTILNLRSTHLQSEVVFQNIITVKAVNVDTEYSGRFY
jgi:hypothetical protein